jgi:ribulose-phosphate 3-epimerase
MTPPVLVAPSLLASDFSRLAEEIRKVEEGGADWLHVDVMDGHFVPNLTLGPMVVAAIRRVSRLPLDVHLMIDDPQRYIRPFLDAGSHALTPHVEAAGLRRRGAVERVLAAIRRGGARAGLSIRPKTRAEALRPYLGQLDLVLVMTVEPGFGGQAFMADMMDKVRAAAAWRAARRARYLIEVDGGIAPETARIARQAGAEVFVAGHAVFRQPDPAGALAALRRAIA